MFQKLLRKTRKKAKRGKRKRKRSRRGRYCHEKLDGSGYPFGKTAEELSEPERIMACADIYQALVEDRPYKKGMDHEKACSIMNDMAERIIRV